MMKISALLTLLVLSGTLQAQPLARRATITGGDPDRGKCTIEVVVDGAADVEIRGDSAVLRNLNGRTPEWRRFQCNAPMPANPANFRFAGVDGRGRQELVRPPSNGGPAVVRIEDRDNGTEGYTFDIFWDNGYGGGGYPSAGGPGPYPRDNGYGRPGGGGFGADQAVRVCQDAIQQQASSRFRNGNIRFLDTAIDNNPGRRDWVVGSFETRGGFGRNEVYRFSCSVNFNNGRVRSAQIEEPVGGGGYRRGGGNGAGAAINTCQSAVEDRVRRDGYDVVEFPSINVDNRPGRNDWIVGTVRTNRRGRSGSFDFSCSVDLNSGSIRSVDVRYR